MQTKKRILVIDDDEFVRAILCEVLEQWHYEVFSARNGQHGIEMIETKKPDIVITDIIMPEKEGIETILEIRKKYPGIKLVAISGSDRGASNINYLDIARNLGANNALQKPIDLDALKIVLKDLSGA